MDAPSAIITPDSVRSIIAESIAATEAMAYAQAEVIAGIASRLADTLNSQGTIYFCGNGGSAADSQHIAAEFVGRFLRERRPLPAVALTTNTSILTAIGNDYGYDEVFSRQVRASVSERDAVVGISTSGNSPNVLEAVRAAKKLGATTIGFSGESGHELARETDLCLLVPTTCTPHIQEAHIVAWHAVCGLIEDSIIES